MCRTAHTLLTVCLAAVIVSAQGTRELPRDRTDQMRALGERSPVRTKADRDLIRKVK